MCSQICEKLRKLRKTRKRKFAQVKLPLRFDAHNKEGIFVVISLIKTTNMYIITS